MSNPIDHNLIDGAESRDSSTHHPEICSILSLEELQQINRKLEKESIRDLNEIEGLMEQYFIMCLNKLHKQLVREIIDPSTYFKELNKIQNCIERFNEAREL